MNDKQKNEMEKGGVVMKKIGVTLFVILFLFFQEIFARGTITNFNVIDENEKTQNFNNEFALEMQKKEVITDRFVGKYMVKIYTGSWKNKETGETKPVLGIYVDNEKNPVVVIFREDLFSKEEIRKKAKEAVDSVIEHLEELDEKENEN